MTGQITLDVDLRNPAHFFAACGIFELAGRRWPESEAWFEAATFRIATNALYEEEPLATILGAIIEADPLVRPASDADHFDGKIAPLILCSNDVRLDWWLRPGGSAEADVFKLWSGQQRPQVIFADLHATLRQLAPKPTRNLLRERAPMSGRFGFDPAPAWNALDVGFSPDAQKAKVLTAPATEIFAAIGLQGFRPRRERRDVAYAAWETPLPLPIARAAASGALGGRRFRFPVVQRGKYKAFGFAEELEETSA
jgi:CRISPR-associated protein Csx14